MALVLRAAPTFLILKLIKTGSNSNLNAFQLYFSILWKGKQGRSKGLEGIGGWGESGWGRGGGVGSIFLEGCYDGEDPY